MYHLCPGKSESKKGPLELKKKKKSRFRLFLLASFAIIVTGFGKVHETTLTQV